MAMTTYVEVQPAHGMSCEGLLGSTVPEETKYSFKPTSDTPVSSKHFDPLLSCLPY